MLRSILAQLEFTYIVRQYDDSGVPFRTHLYVPEVHPDSGTIFLEREDEGHVLKVLMLVITPGVYTLIIYIFYRELLSALGMVDHANLSWNDSLMHCMIVKQA